MDIETSERPGGRRGAHRSGAVRRLLAATSLAGVVALAPAGAASAADCTTGTLLQRLLCHPPAPAPTTTTTVPAATPTVTVPTLPPVTVAPAPALPSTARVVPEAGRRLLELANAERRQAGVGALEWRDDVAAIAVAHSHRMAAAGDVFHNDSYFSAATKNLLNAAARGENVAYNGSVDDAHRRLMASPGHRANLVDRRFSVVGMGVVLAPDGRYFVTQNFLQPAGAPRVAAASAPRPAAPRPPRAAARPPVVAAGPVPTTAPPAPVTTTTTGVTAELTSLLDSPGPVAAAQLPTRSTSRSTLPLAALAVALVGACACATARSSKLAADWIAGWARG